MIKCPKCVGRGFTELEHGLIMVECDECEGKGEVEERKGLDMANNPLLYGIDSYIPPEEVESIELPKELEVADDKPDKNGDDLQTGVSGDRLDTPDTGSGDTGEPKLTQKPKAKKKARKSRR